MGNRPPKFSEPCIKRVRPLFELTARDAIGGDASRGIHGAMLLPRFAVIANVVTQARCDCQVEIDRRKRSKRILNQINNNVYEYSVNFACIYGLLCCGGLFRPIWTRNQAPSISKRPGKATRMGRKSEKSRLDSTRQLFLCDVRIPSFLFFHRYSFLQSIHLILFHPST